MFGYENHRSAFGTQLTCPSVLAPPLGEELLFLNGMPTFQPFVSDCKEKVTEEKVDLRERKRCDAHRMKV